MNKFILCLIFIQIAVGILIRNINYSHYAFLISLLGYISLVLLLISVCIDFNKSKRKNIFIIAWVFIFTFILSNSLPYEENGSLQSKIRQTLSKMRSEAELIYEKNSFHSYKFLCSDSTILNHFKELNDIEVHKGPIKCYADNDSYVITTIFGYLGDSKDIVGWCVDSTGEFKQISVSEYDKINNPNTLCN